jgi:hypothetical protein
MAGIGLKIASVCIFLGDVPPGELVFFCSLFVTGSGFFIIFRERQLGLQRGKARRYQPLNG